jgi:two-component system chemotaxis sensor kinase CheA
VEPRSSDPACGVLVVVESTRRTFCVLVDELIGKQEVVIKSLGETCRNVPGIAGGSILGDGRVGLILDVEALFASPSRE